MRKLKKSIIVLFIFLLVGEAVVRFDADTMFFQGSRFVELDTTHRASRELDLLRAGTYEPVADEYRVMLLGDSYLNGKGVPERRRFVDLLREQLRQAGPGGCRDVIVLDLTVAGHNTFQNARTFFEYVDAYQPHALVWAYFLNDVYTRSEVAADARPADQPQGKEAAAGTGRPTRLSTAEKLRSALTAVQSGIYKHSKLLRYVMPTLNQELKARGIVVPGSQFDHERSRSHDPDFPLWQRSREVMDEVWQRCTDDGIAVTVLNCPYLSLLKHYSLFDHVDRQISEYFGSRDVSYVRGADCFLDLEDADYSVSRYDSHPNELAHGILADAVADVMLADGPSCP